MTATGDAPLLRQAADLWSELAGRAGLDDGYYDKELLDDIAGHLGVGRTGPLSQRLAGVSAQQLIDALLAALQPFAGMLQDLLALYAAIGAQQAAAANLRIEYDFSKGNALKFDLTEFRDLAERWTRVTRPATVQVTTNDELFRLVTALPAWSAEAAETYPAPGTDVRVWIDNYDPGQSWPDALPMFPSSGDPLIDEVVDRMHHLVQEVLDTARARSTSLDDLKSQSKGEIDAIAEGNLLFTLADDWPLQATQRTYLLADESAQSAHAATLLGGAHSRIRNDPYDRRRGARRVRALLNALPSVVKERTTRIRELEALLSLPVWGKRHEMYSAWVLTQIVDALRPRPIDLHVVDGVLSFSFSGTHLATIHTEKGPHELWAELRSALPEMAVGKGRTSRIQPDYVLLRHPITADSSAVLVVECKQYRRSSTRNFRDALIDYSNGHSRAEVLLVNYGPISRNVTVGGPKRTTAIGALRPLSPAALTAFADAVHAAVPGQRKWSIQVSTRTDDHAPADQPSHEPTDTDAVVTLIWQDGDDLDLHLHESTGAWSVNYMTPTSPDTHYPVFARFFGDTTTSPGSEQAMMVSVTTPIEVWVHNYTNRLPLAQCGISVDIVTTAQHWRTETAPMTGATQWHVCTIMPNGEILPLLEH